MPVGPYGALLDAVRGVRWPARRRVAGGAPGAHQARTRGVAPEFAEYRPYRQGDDPKRLDWKLLARSDRAFVRLAPDHAVLGTTIVLDASASMDFPAGAAESKWVQAKRLAVALTAVAHASGDPVGLVLVGGEVGRDAVRRLEPRTRRGVIGDVARAVDAVRPGGSARFADAVTQAAPRCVVISDCLDDFEPLRAALARHVVKGGEAVLLHLVARRELEPAAGDAMARDPEDPSLRRPLVAATRPGYRAAFDAFRADVAQRLRADGVVVHEVMDDEPPDTAVRAIARPVGAEVQR